ncbi:hypothetical protein [Chondromyces crocatus]|uniref:Uncharacterized protein n=1 Tax=Chondromyces crocatus TaxID=52 RepID=A0A0K1EHS2_CHOCO|nr:hypothetical protein [Chondromyces crocatus]AKT40426.1 uncharacterized protein CMC5_045790 [Chondromyces crocatus]
MRSKSEMLAELGGLLREMFEARAAGGLNPRIARTQGQVDGYMRALLDQGTATRQELLTLVSEERTRASGPATREIDVLDDEPASAEPVVRVVAA